MPKKSDARLKKEGTSTRKDRAAKNRAFTENRTLTDSERKDAFRQSFFQSALPDLPKMPGYHVCWLTTMNPRDPVHGRLRLGYELIKSSEMPGWEHSSLKTGEYAGCLGVNEMLAAKIPLHLYEMYMHEAHYEQPRREEEHLREKNESVQEKAAQLGQPSAIIQEEQANAQMGNVPPPKPFADEYGEE